MKRSLCASCACWAATALLGLNCGTLRAQPSPVIQTETRVVLVDTIVTGKKGDYIRDLAAKDFKVWEDNKEQTIKSVSLESASSDSAQPRYLVLFFDSAAIQGGDAIQVQQSVASFIDANAGPNRMMSVVNYNGVLRVAQKFTDNAGRLKDAVKAVSTSGGARDANSAASDLRTRDMLRALGNLAKNLSALPGRKIVVLLTGGLSPTTDQRILATSTIEAANMAGVAFYPIDVRPVSVARLGSGISGADTGTQDAAANADASAPRSRGGGRGGAQGALGGQDQSTDVGCIATSRLARTACQDSGSQEILYALSNGTGGFVIKNSSAMVGELPTVGKEQDQYYVISYTPPESKEGSCHTLKVKVARGGTSVRSRSNYCTVKPLDLLAGTTTGKELESHATGSQPGSLNASMQLPYFYNSTGVPRVNLAMEINPDAVKFENQKGGKMHGEINLLGIATGPDGAVAARFSDVIKLDFDNAIQFETLKGKTVHYEKEFKIAPGQYKFTMVFGSGNVNFGKLEMPLAVDPWKADALALSGLVLSREVHPAGDVDLGLAGALAGDRTPLITDDVQVIPFGSNQLGKADTAYYYFEIYVPKNGIVGGHVRILDRKTGEAKWDPGRIRLDSPHQGGIIPVDKLGPGSYQLEVAAGDYVDTLVKHVLDFEIK